MNRKTKRKNKAAEQDLQKTTILEMRKTMDVGGKAKVLNKPTMNLGKTIPFEQVEEIVKTTDSMQIVAKSFKNIEETDVKRLSEASKAILRSYDLAVRKIKATYQDILESKKAIGTEFMTVQILIKRYEEFPDTKKILDVVNVFTKEVETLLSFGKGIWFSNELVLESADYINKMIPIARIITSDAIIVNMIRWEEVADLLIKQGKISSPEKGIIESYVGAINSNIRNGYFLKFGHLLIARIRPTDPECMVLFSGETIQRMNKTYSHHRANNRNGIINKSNYLSKFMSNVNFQKQKDRDLKEQLDTQMNVQKHTEKREEQEIHEREATIPSENLKSKEEQVKEEQVVEASENFEEEISDLKDYAETQQLLSEDENLETKTPAVENSSSKEAEEIVDLAKSDITNSTPVETTNIASSDDDSDEAVEILDDDLPIINPPTPNNVVAEPKAAKPSKKRNASKSKKPKTKEKTKVKPAK